MMKKFFIAVILVLIVYGFFWTLAAPNEKLKRGDAVDPMVLTSIVGANVQIPSPTARLVHLQFRRFAGCPICNLHMHKIIDRYDEIQAVGIKEVVIFHSPKASLIGYQGKFPFDVIADPEKKLYARFGIDTSLFALLDFRVWSTMFQAVELQDKPTGEPEGGVWTRPAEFLIDQFGKVYASHYGRHAADQWSVDELLDKARR